MNTKANDDDGYKTISRLAADSSQVAFAKTSESDETDSADRPASIWRRVIANCIDAGIYSIGTVIWYLFYVTTVQTQLGRLRIWAHYRFHLRFCTMFTIRLVHIKYRKVVH